MSRSDEIAGLLAEYRRTGREEARERLVTLNRGIVTRLAARFRTQPAASYEDLVQVGYLGLLQAIDRFDPARGEPFLPFAVATILGVIRRSLRDHAWAVRAPRRICELLHRVRRARSRLEAQYGRCPTPEELCAETGLAEAQMCRVLELDRVCFVGSLDELCERQSETAELRNGALLVAGAAYDAIVERVGITEMLSRLHEREREVILGRFYADLTQADVAARLGISQMQVSRLERRALTQLRILLASEPSHPAYRLTV